MGRPVSDSGHHRPWAPPTSVDFPDVLRPESLRAFDDVELDSLPFLKTAIAVRHDGGGVHEYVTTLGFDKVKALLAIESLHGALRHRDLL